MSNERPSPFTIPEPTFKFAEGPPSEPPPPRPTTVEGLIHNLTVFADFYEQASADIERAQPFEKPHHRGGRDANADYYQRCFRATPGIDRVRGYVLSRYGEELTIGTARRFLGDLIRVHKLSVEAASALSLEAAMDRLDADTTPGERGRPGPAGSSPSAPCTKRSTERGEGRLKLIGALSKHHQYADGGCLNLDPIGNNELAKLADVSTSTASAFFTNEFEGHTKYKALCRDVGRLAAALKLLNNEFSPHDLYGRRPADEGDEGDLK